MALSPEFLTRPITHRGLPDLSKGVPENSPAAFLAAIEHGYGIELDLQLSADGQAMVFHDETLDRLTDETGLVQQRSAEELQRIGLMGGTDTIPTLAQVLDLVNGRVPLLVEIKDQDGALGPNTGALEQDAARQLKTYKGPVGVMSFNPHAVAAFSAHAPDIPIGLVTCDFPECDWAVVPPEIRSELSRIESFEKLGACFISHDRTDLNNASVARIKHAGHPVLCWTVRSLAEEREARKVADNITFEGYLA